MTVGRPRWLAAIEAIEAGADAGSLEDDHLEFKESRGLRETLQTLADATVCFANAQGGTIVLGVADRGGGASIVGADDRFTIDVVRRGIFDRTRPAVTVTAERVERGACSVIVIDVPPGVVPCATTDGTATRRLGSECRPYTPDQQREWLVGRGMLDWSAQSSGIPLDGADPVELERLRQLLARAGHTDVARLSDAGMLADLRLSAGDELRYAGVILVGTADALAEAVPVYGYGYQFRHSGGTESSTRFRDRRPLLSAIEHVLDTVAARAVSRPLNLAGGVQLVLTDYPADAVRELVVNAFLHRSYETLGSVEIDHSPDGLEVVSPGGLVSGVTPANILTHPPTPRNQLLADTVALVRIAERTGQGIDRVYREVLRIGKQPIAVTDTGALVRVRIDGGGGDDAFARYLASLPGEAQADLEILMTLSLLRGRRTIDAARLAASLQRSLPEAEAALSRLASDPGRIVEPTARGRTYRLTAAALTGLGRAVRYHAAVAGDFDEKVVGHLDEYGTISNRTLQRLFDLTVWSARDALRDLQQRGIVRKLPGPERGPAVQYGPGPAVARGRARARSTPRKGPKNP